MKTFQRILILTMIGMWLRSIFMWILNERVSPAYYFFSTTLSLGICVAVMLLEFSLNLNKEARRWISEDP